MAIHTQESLSGFIASEPHLSFTERGDARLFVKIGQEHFRREDDGSFTQTETTFHDLVVFRKTAEHAQQRFAKGDKFVAEGYTHHYDRADDNGQTVNVEEFVAKKIGHDLARTRYIVERPHRATTTALDAGLEDEALLPDAARRTSANAAAIGR